MAPSRSRRLRSGSSASDFAAVALSGPPHAHKRKLPAQWLDAIGASTARAGRRVRPLAVSVLHLPDVSLCIGRTLRAGAQAKVRPALLLSPATPPMRLAVRETRAAAPAPRSLYARTAGRDICPERTEFEPNALVRLSALQAQVAVPTLAGLPGAPFAAGGNEKSDFQLYRWHDHDLFELSQTIHDDDRGLLAYNYLAQLLPMLAQAHRARVWLGEIKLSNVMFDAAAGSMAFIDFSSALIGGERVAATSRRRQLVAMPPEALCDAAWLGVETDVWALGATAFELLGDDKSAALPPFHSLHPDLARYGMWYARVAPEGRFDAARLAGHWCRSWDEWARRAWARSPTLARWLLEGMLAADPAKRPSAAHATQLFQALEPAHDQGAFARFREGVERRAPRRVEDLFFALEHARTIFGRYEGSVHLPAPQLAI